jgi:hypothetical protein
LYGCETWSWALREENRLKALQNRVIRSIFGPKRDEIRGGRKKLLIEELHNLYSSPEITRMIMSRRTRWVGNVKCIQGKGIHTGS